MNLAPPCGDARKSASRHITYAGVPSRPHAGATGWGADSTHAGLEAGQVDGAVANRETQWKLSDAEIVSAGEWAEERRDLWMDSAGCEAPCPSARGHEPRAPFMSARSYQPATQCCAFPWKELVFPGRVKP